ncbi:hypothetical protein ACFL0U_04365 [Pseudomonadota bacterium]
MFPTNFNTNSNYKLEKEITKLYAGSDVKQPNIEYVSYDYWLKHEKYDSIKNELEKLIKEDALISRAYKNEADYFYSRLKDKKSILHKNLFLEQSYNYLFDETVPFIIKHSNPEQPIIEFYINGRDMQVSLGFKGKKAQKDPIIQKYLQGPLKGADQRKFVSVKMVKE